MTPVYWDLLAAAIQQRNRESEGAKGDIYTDEEVRRSAVYSREDLVLIVSYLSSANLQLSQIRTALAAITIGIAFLVVATIFLAIVMCLRSA